MGSNNVWDYWADKYEGLWVQKISLKPTRRRILEEILKRFDNKFGFEVLDMGCGTGQLLREIKGEYGYNAHLTGVDISEKMISAAREKDNTLLYIQADVDHYEETESKYDIIICSHSFPYYRHKLESLYKFNQLLKPGGYLFLAQACENNIFDKIIMSLVKLTTSRANYLCKTDLDHMLTGIFGRVEHSKISKKIYMPSIILFICQRDKG